MRPVPALELAAQPGGVLRLQLRQHAVDEVGVDVVARAAAAQPHAARRAAAPARRHAHAGVVVWGQRHKLFLITGHF